jgi:hypothetical protein
MYLSATMTIDPSSLTHVRRKPTKGFRRFAELLTANLISKREEHEAFTALSIIQELNVALRSIGVTDVVKFTKDDQDLYDDSASTSTDDMPQVIDALTRSRQPNQEPFSRLSLLLEHHLDTIALIIEIKVLRVHEVGIYPIQVTINGLDSQMQAADSSTALGQQLDQVFASQQTYDAYVESKKTEFEAFMVELEQAFRTRMKIENLHSRIYTNVVRPGLKPTRPTSSSSDPGANFGSADSSDERAAPMFQRYHSSGGMDSLMYLWMWSSFMHSNNTHCQQTTIVDETGTPAFTVGEEGFNAGESATLDPDASFEAPDCPIEPVEGVGGEVSDNTDFGLFGGDSGSGTDAGSSWFDSFAFGGDSSGSDAGSGGSSCGGGASCGSSCGGGCGGGCGS